MYMKFGVEDGPRKKWFGSIRNCRCSCPLANQDRYGVIITCTLWFFNIAIEHCPFIDGLPIKHGDLPWLC